jgi:predicted 2-oxoglutarate/Fe(II)-dependent dioxygenase YbiX
MSKRLQVILDDEEMKAIATLARKQKVTVSSWVRATLREARIRHPLISGDRKIQVVRAATRHAFPTSDLDRMLAEIESGYQSGAGT